MEAKRHLIVLDRDLMWEYYLYYKKKNPRVRTFPFAKKITEKLYKSNGEPQLTKGGRHKTKTRKRNLKEIEKDNLLYKVLSLNDLLPIDSMNYSTQKKKWGDLGVFLAQHHNVDGMRIENSLVEFRFFAETKAKSDLDNLIGSSKLLSDGLFVQSEMFIDDNYNHINPLLVFAEVDKNYPHMEIRITEFDKRDIKLYEKVKIHIAKWENI
jgi:hypothetical protein